MAGDFKFVYKIRSNDYTVVIKINRNIVHTF